MYAVVKPGSRIFRSACGTKRSVLVWACAGAGTSAAAVAASSAAAQAKWFRRMVSRLPGVKRSSEGHQKRRGDGVDRPTRAADPGVSQSRRMLRCDTGGVDINHLGGDFGERSIKMLGRFDDHHRLAAEHATELREQVGVDPLVAYRAQHDLHAFGLHPRAIAHLVAHGPHPPPATPAAPGPAGPPRPRPPGSGGRPRGAPSPPPSPSGSPAPAPASN